MRELLKTKVKSILYLSIMMLSVSAIAGCAMTMTIKDPATSLQFNGKKSGTITVSNIIIDSSLSEKKIGKASMGLLQIPLEYYYGTKAIEGKSLYLMAMEEELRAAGYPVLLSSTERAVFEQASEKAQKADLLIGGVITSIDFNSYAHMMVYSEAKIVVKWQLFDNHMNQMVFERELTGEAKGPDRSITTIVGALRGSFKQLLAEKEFMQVVSDVLP